MPPAAPGHHRAPDSAANSHARCASGRLPRWPGRSCPSAGRSRTPPGVRGRSCRATPSSIRAPPRCADSGGRRPAPAARQGAQPPAPVPRGWLAALSAVAPSADRVRRWPGCRRSPAARRSGRTARSPRRSGHPRGRRDRASRPTPAEPPAPAACSRSSSARCPSPARAMLPAPSIRQPHPTTARRPPGDTTATPPACAAAPPAGQSGSTPRISRHLAATKRSARADRRPPAARCAQRAGWPAPPARAACGCRKNQRAVCSTRAAANRPPSAPASSPASVPGAGSSSYTTRQRSCSPRTGGECAPRPHRRGPACR
ncbi:MAG: hypothetical protein AW08_01598 [Candidatus Accumulibacter adjunctus]|uniref:Uncharacterized protein n=1 Tax=Candidatus Accumulibacter adjunctus TaxID=1454001 RepID=A0A011ME20_9PROT|nr:MAG: hypothetical protein AW08_01598 [Candidatus Accumulibacter adjunctus]